MHEVVLSNFNIRRPKSLRRPSFAGNGLPERMRSTAFAFLGLTAALGLALVAIFAQLSFPVLAPAPPPAGPAGHGGLSASLALGQGRRDGAPQRPSLAAAQPAAGASRDGTVAGAAVRDDASLGDLAPTGSVGVSGNGAGSGDGESAESPPAAPPSSAPSGEQAAGAEAAPAPVTAPVPTSPSPGPVTSTPKPTEPEATPEPTEPETAPVEEPEGGPEEESEDHHGHGWGGGHGHAYGHYK
jgi:hypothetical protein